MLCVPFILLQVETIDDYDEYCHYVAGLVGLGLSKLFHASGSEDLLSDSLSNSMGLFLQVLISTCIATNVFHSLSTFMFGSLILACIFCMQQITENQHYSRLPGGH